MPALDLLLEIAQQYGKDMLALQLTPKVVLERATVSTQPLQTVLALLDLIGGYKEDPLRKKSSLLALILNQHPKCFLPLRQDEQVEPVIDYHAMCACLRIGIIEVLDKELTRKLLNRQMVSPLEEWSVRYACYRAYQQLVALTGKTYGVVGLVCVFCYSQSLFRNV